MPRAKPSKPTLTAPEQDKAVGTPATAAPAEPNAPNAPNAQATEPVAASAPALAPALASVLDGLTAHVCVLDAHGVILAVNQAWREFALANGAAPGASCEGSNYLHVCEQAALSALPSKDHASAFLAQLRLALAGQQPRFVVEYPCDAPQAPRWFVVHVSRLAGPGPLRLVVAHDDITELKQAQETLRAREALLLDLAASIPGALFRLVLAPLGEARYTYLSPGVVDLYGVTPQQVMADQTLLRRCIVPQDQEAHARSVQGAVANNGPWEHEFRIQAVGGPVKWVHAKAQPTRRSQHGVVWTGLLTDVSDRKRIEADMRASEETYRTLFETSPHGVVYHDASGLITSANPAAQRILGLTLAQMQGRSSIDPRWQAIHEDGTEFPGAQHPAMQALQTGQSVSGVVMGVYVPDRGHTWLLVNAMPLFKQGQVDSVYATFEDITERVLLARELRRQATTDELTGVANRRSLMLCLANEYDRVRRHPTMPCSVLAVDLDHFKLVNDTWGHAVGDATLAHVARLMQAEVRSCDLVGRTGGEEFVLLLPGAGLADAAVLADRLRGRVQSTPLVHEGTTVHITLSIGASAISTDDANADAVLARADRALYAAKSAGRNVLRLLAAS
jgi:diguanylate cyclase (GGDEF)-like protein/PAS domain S-box-containing protein